MNTAAPQRQPAPPASHRHAAFDAELQARGLDLALLRRLLAWLLPHWRPAALSTALIVVSAVLAIAMPAIIGRVVIDGVLAGDQPVVAPDFGLIALNDALAGLLGIGTIASACVLYMLVTTLWALTGHLHRVQLARAVLGALCDLRHALFERTEHRSATFWDNVAVGRVMTRITNDVEVLFQLLAGFGVLIGEFAPFIVAVALMLTLDSGLTGALLLVLPVVGAATWLFRRASETVYRTIRETVSGLNQNLQENLSGMTVVQLSRRERQNLDRYMGINRANRHAERLAVEYEVRYSAFMDSMAPVALAVILWVGGGNALQAEVSLGTIVLFSQFADMLFRPIVALGEQYNVIFRAMASAERIFQALDWDEPRIAPEHPVDLPERLAGAIEFRNLSFRYAEGPPVLHGIDLAIHPGETLAIVGPTGSGKSTLIRLLGRFYDVEPGTLLLDGMDIRGFDVAALRRRIGVVLQDFHVFAGTVRDNIGLGDPACDDARIEAAARLVGAHDFIMALPQGYATPLTERGQNLSHGQRQLLAFARVLVRDPQILVLDEATSSIDTESERRIEAGLAALTRGRTSIIIAHRLQTIERADRIVVLQGGRIAEVDTHAALLAANGLYRTLHELQFQLDGNAAPVGADGDDADNIRAAPGLRTAPGGSST